MINVYLFIELLRAASVNDVTAELKKIEFDGCRFANIVVLADDKLVAQLDCENGVKASAAVLNKIAPVAGVVQTNIISAVTPVNR